MNRQEAMSQYATALKQGRKAYKEALVRGRVSLLDVKAAEVLIAPDGVPDALVPQVGLAEADPLPGKLRVRQGL